MGDRCWMTIKFLLHDREAVLGVLDAEGWTDYVDALRDGSNGHHGVFFDDDYIEVSFDEVNYGGDSLRELFMAQGIVFVGHHDHGDEYSGQEFVFLSDKEKYLTVEAGGGSIVAITFIDGAVTIPDWALTRATNFFLEKEAFERIAPVISSVRSEMPRFLVNEDKSYVCLLGFSMNNVDRLIVACTQKGHRCVPSNKAGTTDITDSVIRWAMLTAGKVATAEFAAEPRVHDAVNAVMVARRMT